jgi:hypothetical protein
MPLIKGQTTQWGNQTSLIKEGQTTQWSNQTSLIEEGQTTQWSKEEGQTTQWQKEKVQKDKQRSTKHYTKTKDRAPRIPLKPGVNSCAPEGLAVLAPYVSF